MKAVRVYKVLIRTRAAVLLQLLQVGLRANKNLLVHVIWELVLPNKLGCIGTLQARLGQRKDAFMVRGLVGGIS